MSEEGENGGDKPIPGDKDIGKCLGQLIYLKENAPTKDLFDSETLIKNAIKTKERYDLHKFDECMHFSEDHKILGKLTGKYCVMAFNSSQAADLKYAATCYPQICTDSELRGFSAGTLKTYAQDLADQWCQTADVTYELSDYFAIGIFVLLAVIVVISTIYDCLKRNSERKARCLTTFSLYSNIKTVFKTTSSDDLNCLYALRTISIFWLIIANRFSIMTNAFPLTNEDNYYAWLENVFSTFIATSDVAYDTLFLISGFLLATYCLRAFAVRSLDVVHLLIHRYFRYMPLLGAAMIYYASILKYTVSGPLTFRLNERIDNCKNYWWTTVIMVENYLTPDKVCLFDGWYFNIDFQFFAFVPLFVLVFYKLPKFGSMILNMIIVGVYAAVVAILIIYDEPYNVTKHVYSLPIYSHFRCAPWIISIFLAAAYKKGELAFRKSTRRLCWIGTFAIFIFYFVFVYFLQNHKYAADSVIAGAVFAGTHRILWALAISWVILSCLHPDENGVIQKILNSPKWKPFGKLSITYLIIHPVYQVATAYSMKNPYDFDSWWTFHSALGDIVFTTFLAVILFACIELPFSSIEASFHKKKLDQIDQLNTVQLVV